MTVKVNNDKEASLSRRGILMCLMSAFLYFYQYMIKVAPNQCINSIIKDCNADQSFTGMLMAVFLIGYTLSQTPVAAACEYYGPRKLMLACTGALSAICLTQSYITSPAAMLFVRFVAGVFSAVGLLATLEMCDRWIPHNYRGRALTAVVIFGIAGAILSGHLVDILLNERSLVHCSVAFLLGGCRFAWQNVFSVLFVVGFGLFALYALLLDDNGPYCVAQNTTQNQGESGGIMSRNMIMNCLYAWTSYIPLEVMANTFGSKYAADVGFTGFLNPQTAILIGMCIGLVVFGQAADKFGFKEVLVPAGIANAALLGLLSFVSHGHVASLLLIMIGIITSTSVLPIAFGAILTPQSPGAARGVSNFAQMGGAAGTSFLTGHILNAFTTHSAQDIAAGKVSFTPDAYNMLWLIYAVCMLSSTVCFAIFIDHQKDKKESK
jgi:MFS family permease